MRSISLILMGVLLASVSLEAQQKPVPAGTEAKAEVVDPGTKLLRAIDSRIYFPFRDGLVDLQFDWKISAVGAVAGVFDGLHLRYSWKNPDQWVTGLVDREGKPAETPAALQDEKGKALLRDLSQGLNAMARQVVIGATFESIYRDYDKRVVSREVNHKLEHRLILTPRSKKRYVSIVMRVVDGLPREFRRTRADGSKMTTRLLFDRRGEKDFLTGIKLEENSRMKLQEVFHYAKRGGLDVVTGIDRYMDKEDARRLQRPVMEQIRFERVRVNTKLPNEIFKRKTIPASAPVKPRPSEKPPTKK